MSPPGEAMRRILPALLIAAVQGAASNVGSMSCANRLQQETAMLMLQGPVERRITSQAVRVRTLMKSCSSLDQARVCDGGSIVSSHYECQDFTEELIDIDSFQGHVAGYGFAGSCFCFERCTCSNGVHARSLQGRASGAAVAAIAVSGANEAKKGETGPGTIIGIIAGVWLVLRVIVACIMSYLSREADVVRNFPQQEDYSTGLFHCHENPGICLLGTFFPYELAARNAFRAGLASFWYAWLWIFACGPFCALLTYRDGLQEKMGMEVGSCNSCQVRYCGCCTSCQEAREIEKAKQMEMAALTKTAEMNGVVVVVGSRQ